MNILADTVFRAGRRNRIRLIAERELEQGMDQDMNRILEWFYGRHCSVRTPKTCPIEGLKPGSRVFTNRSEMFVVVEDKNQPKLHSAFGESNQVVEVAIPGSGVLAGSYLVEVGEDGELVYKHIVRKDQVETARAKIKKNIRASQSFIKLMSRKKKIRKRDLAFPEGSQPGDPVGTLWQPPCREHVSFRGWRSGRDF